MIDFLATYGQLMVLLTFFCIFLAFSFWAYRPSNKKKIEAYGIIPLKENENGHS